MTTAVSVLEERLAKEIGDYIEVVVTTAINADNLVVSTNLRAYDDGRDDRFIEWWCYITDKANITVHRRVSDYATATGTLTVDGAVLADDAANLATIRLHRYNRDLYMNAINDAIREVYPQLHKKLDVIELVTGNNLPNSHFRDWTSASYPDNYAVTNATAAATTTAGLFRGGGKSALVTASAADGYMYITSATWPRLLDLQGKTVNFYAWAYPSVANDAFLTIYTLKNDGTTAQTLNSTTTCATSQYTLLKLESQTLNDDLSLIQFRFRVHTNLATCYFDNARVRGRTINEYLLPTDFETGDLDSVQLQLTSAATFACDDLMPQSWETIRNWGITDDGTNSFLQIPSLTEHRLLRLIGKMPLSTVSAYTDTIEIDGEELNLFIAYAKYKFYRAIEGPIAVTDKGRYELESAKAYGEYQRLLGRMAMTTKTPIRMWTY